MKKLKEKFSKIYDKYIEKIYRFVFFKVNSPEVAEDLTSETFLRGWEAFQAKSEKIENPSAFLYQIARNLITNHYREKNKVQIVSAEIQPIVDPRQDLENQAIAGSDLERIKKAMVDLKDDYQNVIIWHYLDDLSIKEIARMLDKTEPATRVLLHRALHTLRNKLNSQS